MSKKKAFQEYYPEELSHCYGCGRLNDKGYHIKSYWDGEESICTYKPESHHIAFPGFVNGGIIATLIDCHGTGTAAAAAYREEGREMDTLPALRFVTASLHVSYLKPTPIDTELTLKGKVKEVKGKKVVVEITLYANKVACAKGEIVAVKIPDTMLLKK